MNRSLLSVVVCLAVTGPALAQRAAPNEAIVREVIRVVKKSPPGQRTLEDAPVGTRLGPGERIRTGGRSAAGLRFPDQSILRIGELSEVVVTNPGRRDAQVVRGQLIASYRAPGRVTGGNAVAAVRGTDLHVVVDASGATEVRCYDGTVYLSSKDNPISAGIAASLTTTSLTDPALVGTTEDYSGGEVRFVDGPHSGQARGITSLDTNSGRVTFSPALAGVQAGEAASGYVLVKKKQQPVVQLARNTGARVLANGQITQSYAVPPAKHAYLTPSPLTEALADGRTESTFPGTDGQIQEQTNRFLERSAIRETTPIPPTGLVCDFGPAPKFLGAGPRISAASLFAQATAGSGTGARPERLFGASALAVPSQTGSEMVQFRFEPFGITSRDADLFGTRVRLQAAQGDVYSEFGYRYTWLDDESHHDLSEAFVQIKGSYGRFILGRQHMFVGPSNNTRVGTLLDLESSDTFAYELPVKKGLSLMGGYVHDSDTFLDGGFSGIFLRAQKPLRGGLLGASLLWNRDPDTNLGWSVDLSQPLIKNKLDVYAEGGVDTHSNALYTAGIYIPAIYHAAKIDVYMEYARRRDVDERVTLRLRRDLGGGFLGVLFLDNRLEGDDHLNYGGGLMWSRAFK